MEKSKQNYYKFSETWQNHGKEAKQLTSTLVLNKWWDSWKMMTCGDDSLRNMVMFPFLWILIHKSKWWSKTRPNLVASQNSYWRIKAQNRHSQVSLDRCLSTRSGRQAIRSNSFITISIHYHIPRGGGGCHRKVGEGFSGLNTKLDTDGQPYLTIPYTSQGFQIIISDWMRWITRGRAYHSTTLKPIWSGWTVSLVIFLYNWLLNKRSSIWILFRT